ncbi:MAG TPA: DUF3619 family protein [Ramlibacter sp.]|nr:DUF3619 family protein [Ramlibacter sp.]
MTNSETLGASRLQDQFGRRVAARLSSGTSELPHHISERLRAARMQAIAQRRAVQPEPVRGLALAGLAGHFSLGERASGFWGRLASVTPLVALVLGLVLINVVQNDLRASEIAEVDAALLIDDLPPAAYADPGFAQFLKTGL